MVCWYFDWHVLKLVEKLFLIKMQQFLRNGEIKFKLVDILDLSIVELLEMVSLLLNFENAWYQMLVQNQVFLKWNFWFT